MRLCSRPRRRGLGQTTAVGIGGDPVNGTNFIDVLELFLADDETESIIMIGEIGGSAEEEAAQFLIDEQARAQEADGGLHRRPHRASGPPHGPCRRDRLGRQGGAEDKIAAMEAAGITRRGQRRPMLGSTLVGGCLRRASNPTHGRGAVRFSARGRRRRKARWVSMGHGFRTRWKGTALPSWSALSAQYLDNRAGRRKLAGLLRGSGRRPPPARAGSASGWPPADGCADRGLDPTQEREACREGPEKAAPAAAAGPSKPTFEGGDARFDPRADADPLLPRARPPAAKPRSRWACRGATFRPISPPNITASAKTIIDRPIYIGGMLGLDMAVDRARDPVEVLRATYCGNVGLEYMHIQTRRRRRFLQERMEGHVNKEIRVHSEGKKAILSKVIHAEGFEKFLGIASTPAPSASASTAARRWFPRWKAVIKRRRRWA
jgi:hypothetical protein